MPINVKKTISIVVLIFFVSAISHFITSYKVRNEAVMNTINIMLYDLATEMDLLEYLEQKSKKDKYLEKNIKHLVLSKIFILSNVKPELNDLKGVPLNALSRAISYHNDYGLGISEFEDAFRSSLLYLKEIESDVIQIKKERRKITKRTFGPTTME